MEQVQHVEAPSARALAAWRSLAIRSLKRPSFVLCGLALLLATQVLPWWPPTPDASCYLSMARSVAAGGPMTNLGSPKLHYAPGYPALISPAFFFSDRPFWLLALMQWAFAVLFMLGVYHWANRWFPAGALWITALVMVNIGFWLLARLTSSEMVFMAALMGNVNALDRLNAARERRETIGWTLVCALGIVALSLIRPVGVLIVAGYGCVALGMAWNQRISWTRAVVTTFAIGLPATAAVLGFLAYETHTANSVGMTTSVTYFDEFHIPGMSRVAQFVEGARLRISEFGRMVVPGMHKSYARRGHWLNVNLLIYVPLFIALMWSWWQISRRANSALVWLLPFYLAVHMGYPHEQGTRYMVPILPLVAACVWRLSCLVPRERQARILGSLVAIHLGVTLGISCYETVQLYRQHSRWADVDALIAAVDGDPRPLATCGAPKGIWEMSQVSSNRPVQWIDAKNSEQLIRHAGWVITAADHDVGPDFEETARAGELKLLRPSVTAGLRNLDLGGLDVPFRQEPTQR